MMPLLGRRSSSFYVVLLGIVAAVVAGLAVVYFNAGSLETSRMPEFWIAVVALVVVASIAVLLVGRNLPFAIWSPIYVFGAVYLILGSAGYVYYRFGTDYLGGFYDIGASDAELLQALSGFFVALASFLVGVIVYLLSSRQFKRLRRFSARGQTTKKTSYSINLHPNRFGAASLAPLLVPFLLYVLGQGIGNVWWRSEYLVEQYHLVLILGGLLSLPVLLVIGYMLPAKKTLPWRMACVVLFILYEVLFLSASSRRFVIAPVFFIVGLAFAGVHRRTIVLLIVAWVLALPFLFNLPLELRGMSEQGLSPLTSNLEEIVARDEGAGYFSTADALIKNIAFGVPLAGYVESAIPISNNYFLVSINPLPSFVPVSGLPSWDDFRDQLRVNEYIPFSALGELLNQGWPQLILYYTAVGLVAAWADIGARVFEGQRSRLGFLFACGLLDFFAISSTQYNLRSATRFIYYAILVIIAWKAFCLIGSVLRRRRMMISGGVHTGMQSWRRPARTRKLP